MCFLFLGSGKQDVFVPRWEQIQHSTRRIRKYATTRHTYTVQCQNHEAVEPTADNVEKLFTSLVEGLTADLDPSHYIGLSMQSPSLDYPITMPYTRLRDFKAANLLDVIQRTLNSNEDFAIDGRLKLELTHVEIPEGRGVTEGKNTLYFYVLFQDTLNYPHQVRVTIYFH